MSAPTIRREPSAWLRGALASELRTNTLLVSMLAAPAPQLSAIVTRLRPTYGDRQCDRCGVEVPEGEDFWSFAAIQGRVLFEVGLCAEHARAEGIEE